MQARPSFRYLSVLVLVLASLALAACGDDSDDSSGDASSTPTADTTTDTSQSDASGAGGGETLAIDAVEDGPEQYSFAPASLTANAGAVEIAMANPSGNQAPHAVEVEGNGVEEVGQTVSPGGGDSMVSVDLKPGKYVFYCPVGNHRDQGMEGTLTVK